MSPPPSFALVTLEPVSGTGSGAQLRNFALLQALSRMGRASHVAISDLIPGNRRLGHESNRIATDFPPEVLARAEALVAGLQPDLVIVEGVRMAQLADRLLAAGHEMVLDMHNVESLLREETGRARRGRLAPFFYGHRWNSARARERALAQAATVVLTCSALDAERVMSLTGPRAVHVVPNPIPAWCIDAEPAAQRGDGSFNALFVGYLSYYPNRIAATRLMRRIMPRLRRVLGGAELTLAGRAPKSRTKLMAARREWVSLHADPPDLMPLYARASCALIPLSEGGGTRLKVLEAMALGLPVIASAKAVEGLGLVAGQAYLHAESDDEFVAACLRLAQSPALKADLARRGRELVFRDYGPDAIFTALSDALSDGVSRKAAAI